MKKQWIQPKAEVQAFIPNEYVAACARCDVTYVEGGFYIDDNKNGEYDVKEKPYLPSFNTPGAACGEIMTKDRFMKGDGFTSTHIRDMKTNQRVYLWLDNKTLEYHLSTGNNNSAS